MLLSGSQFRRHAQALGSCQWRTARWPEIGLHVCSAEPEGQGISPPAGSSVKRPREQRPPPPPAMPKLPKTGLFALADTNAEVYSKAGEKFDPTKKPGRYQPEFIWNTNWQEQLEREESLLRARARAEAEPEELPEGFLSFSRISDLNDMSVDLSAQLRPRAKPSSGTASTSGSSASTGGSKSSANSAGVAFTRKEVGKLQRVSRSVARGAGSPLVAANTPAEFAAEQARLAEEETARYEQLKLDFQLWTFAFGAAGCAAVYNIYGQEPSISFAVGALGGLVYVRLLSRSVDGVATGGGVASMVGQQRLLIPVILALGYNRWNNLAAEQTGLTLQLLPMLVGFLTYKLAVIARQGKDVLDAANGKLSNSA